MNFLQLLLKIKGRIYSFNHQYTIIRPKDYKPETINDEIIAEFNRRKIVVQSIHPLDAYSIIGCKVRTHKQCKELQDYFKNL